MTWTNMSVDYALNSETHAAIIQEIVDCPNKFVQRARETLWPKGWTFDCYKYHSSPLGTWVLTFKYSEPMTNAYMVRDMGRIGRIIARINSETEQSNDKNAVRLPTGEVELFMVKVLGVPFKCECGCILFYKPDDTDTNLLKCNVCGAKFEST